MSKIDGMDGVIFGLARLLEEVSQNMYCILSVIEYIIMEVSQNISIYSYSVTLAYNGITIRIYLKTHTLECIFSHTWS